jgi:hypothetical protein
MHYRTPLAVFTLSLCLGLSTRGPVLFSASVACQQHLRLFAPFVLDAGGNYVKILK